jgi:hypothetical protein
LAIVQAQIAAVEQIIRTLEEMEETTHLRSWSPEIRQEHLLAVDNLRALASFLAVYGHTLEDRNSQ